MSFGFDFGFGVCQGSSGSFMVYQGVHSVSVLRNELSVKGTFNMYVTQKLGFYISTPLRNARTIHFKTRDPSTPTALCSN